MMIGAGYLRYAARGAAICDTPHLLLEKKSLMPIKLLFGI